MFYESSKIYAHSVFLQIIFNVGQQRLS